MTDRIRGSSSASTATFTGIVMTSVVKPGETLADVAKRAGVPLEDLRKANPQIKDAETVPAGTQLQFPPGQASANVQGAAGMAGKIDSFESGPRDQFGSLVQPQPGLGGQGLPGTGIGMPDPSNRGIPADLLGHLAGGPGGRQGLGGPGWALPGGGGAGLGGLGGGSHAGDLMGGVPGGIGGHQGSLGSTPGSLPGGPGGLGGLGGFTRVGDLLGGTPGGMGGMHGASHGGVSGGTSATGGGQSGPGVSGFGGSGQGGMGFSDSGMGADSLSGGGQVSGGGGVVVTRVPVSENDSSVQQLLSDTQAERDQATAQDLSNERVDQWMNAAPGTGVQSGPAYEANKAAGDQAAEEALATPVAETPKDPDVEEACKPEEGDDKGDTVDGTGGGDDSGHRTSGPPPGGALGAILAASTSHEGDDTGGKEKVGGGGGWVFGGGSDPDSRDDSGHLNIGPKSGGSSTGGDPDGLNYNKADRGELASEKSARAHRLDKQGA